MSRRHFLVMVGAAGAALAGYRVVARAASHEGAIAVQEVELGEDVFAYVSRVKGGFDQTLYQQVIGAANDFYRMSIYEAATVNVLQCKSGMAPATNSGAGIIAHVPSMPTAGDQRLGFYLFGGWDGSVGRNSVGMSGFSAEAWTAGSVQGSYLTLETTPTGSATRAARVRIGPAGQVYCPAIGTTASAANAARLRSVALASLSSRFRVSLSSRKVTGSLMVSSTAMCTMCTFLSRSAALSRRGTIAAAV